VQLPLEGKLIPKTVIDRCGNTNLGKIGPDKTGARTTENLVKLCNEVP
jgi:hypothetical protein